MEEEMEDGKFLVNYHNSDNGGVREDVKGLTTKEDLCESKTGSERSSFFL